MRAKRFVLILLTLLSLLTGTNSKRVLFVPGVIGSHLLNHIAIGEKLASLYHHEVHITVPKNYTLPHKLQPLYYTPVLNETIIESLIIESMKSNVGLFARFIFLPKTRKMLCDAILKDHKVMREIISRNFDYILIDSIAPCYHLLPKILKVPYSSSSAHLLLDPPSETGVPPSIQRTSLNPYSNDFSYFLPRIKNFFILTIARLTNAFLNRKVEKDYIQFNNIFVNEDEIARNSRSDIHIITKSSFFMQSTPRSTAVVVVGGALAVPVANKNETGLLEFVNSSDKDIILVSFGSYLNFLPSAISSELVNTFNELPQFNFIFKYDCTNIPSIPSNVKCVAWMPQTEILNLDLTKLFITNGGCNSMHESTIAGVPMVVMPLFGDQFYNGKLIEEKGLGKVIDFKQVKNLKTVILDVINNDSYKSNSVRASGIMHELEPDPAAKAAYYLNHVILYGAKHLQSNVDNLWLYQIYMYDIAIVCLIIILSCTLLTLLIFWKCFLGKITGKKLKSD